MFWSTSISSKNSVKLADSQQDRDESNDMLHISNACLDMEAPKGKVYVQVKRESGVANICVLTKDSNEHCNLDIYFKGQEEIIFQTAGSKATVHLTGYWEPS